MLAIILHLLHSGYESHSFHECSFFLLFWVETIVISLAITKLKGNRFSFLKLFIPIYNLYHSTFK